MELQSVDMRTHDGGRGEEWQRKEGEVMKRMCEDVCVCMNPGKYWSHSLWSVRFHF